jgi:serine/threonine protein kinase
VQVSDWFDGESLEVRWRSFADLPLLDRVGVFLSAARGLQYCHGLGVFHRNFSAEAILISDDWQDVRVSGFEYARDIELNSTVTTGHLQSRDPRLIPPEELADGISPNPRLGDVFQAGVLLFRLVCGGSWPFDSSHQYLISHPDWDALTRDLDPSSARALKVAVKMLSIDASRRPGSLGAVVAELQSVVSAQS